MDKGTPKRDIQSIEITYNYVYIYIIIYIYIYIYIYIFIYICETRKLRVLANYLNYRCVKKQQWFKVKTKTVFK